VLVVDKYVKVVTYDIPSWEMLQGDTDYQSIIISGAARSWGNTMTLAKLYGLVTGVLSIVRGSSGAVQ
jgi:hypothetical protein